MVTDVWRICGGAAAVLLASAGCGDSSKTGTTGTDAGRIDAARDTGVREDARARDAQGNRDALHIDAPTDAPSVLQVDAARCTGGCPTGYACGTANGHPVCRAPSGVPLFSHVFVIMEENTSLSTLLAAINANAAPNFASLLKTYASGTQYHGVAHPSLPNYVALTSGGTQGLACDCAATAGLGTCNSSNCYLLASDSCTCVESVPNLADQLETANKSWMAYGETMVTPCNTEFTNDAGTYSARHVPFLYYTDIQTNSARCTAHVVDYSLLDLASASDFTYIAPNLIDDMHSPFPATQGNITSGDNWIGPVVAQITASSAYADGGLFVIVWDEDDDSGILDPNSAILIFVLSPYAKAGGYMSAATMDHYSLLATIEDGMNLPRLGNAAVPRASTAETLADYFPDE